MLYTLNTNIAALNAKNTSRLQGDALQESLQRLSTGLRINSSADDAGGLVVANTLRSQELSTGEALKNVNTAIGIFQLIDSALDKQIKILDTIKIKAIQAANDGQSQSVRDALQKEVAELAKELDNIARTTKFNNTSLLDGSFVNNKFQIGAYANDLLDFSIQSTETDKIGYSSYHTTYGGSRDIEDLQLTFKDAGHGGEDVTLAPFTLSYSAGKSLQDLASLVNKASEKTGVRAVYREGAPAEAYELNALATSQASAQTRSLETTDSVSPLPTSQERKINIPSIEYFKAPVATQEVAQVATEPSTPDLVLPVRQTANQTVAISSGEDIQIDLKGATSETESVNSIYPISFRVANPSVIFPIGNTFYEDVPSTGAASANTFNNSTILLSPGDETFDTNILNKITASVDGQAVAASFRLLPNGNIEASLTGTVNGVTSTNTSKLIDFTFADDILVSGKQLDPAQAVLAYSDNPVSRFVVENDFKERPEGAITGQQVTIHLLGDTLDPAALAVLSVSATDPAFDAFIGNRSVVADGNRKLIVTISASGIAPHGAADDQKLTLTNFIAANTTTGRAPSNPRPSIIVDMLDPPTLTLKDSAVRQFQESSDNDGFISTSIVLELEGDRYNQRLSSAQIASMLSITDANGVSLTNTYRDLALEYNINNGTELTVTFRRSAQNSDTSINNAQISYNANADALFQNGLAPTNPTTGVSVSFLTEPTVTNPQSYGFREAAANDGTFTAPVRLTLPATETNTFSLDVVNQIDAVNIPDGLTPVYSRISDREISIELEGTAVNHARRTLTNTGFGFKKDAFINPVSTYRSVNVEFNDAATFTVTGHFKEDPTLNNGTILDGDIVSSAAVILEATGTVAIGQIFNGTDVSSFFTATNLPAGLTPYIETIDVTGATTTFKALLLGQATEHEVNLNNISFQADASLFGNGVLSKPISPLSIEFIAEQKIDVFGYARESLSNDGSIDSAVTFTLKNDAFTGAVPVTDADLLANIDIDNLPAGLIPVYEKVDDSTIIARFDGNADPHFAYSVPSSLNVSFNPAILQASTVPIVAQVQTEFFNPTPELTVAYGQFYEGIDNNGAIDTTVGLALPSGAVLRDEVKQEFIDDPEAATRKYVRTYNLPYVLTPVLNYDPNFPEILEVKLNGNALQHSPRDSEDFKLRLSPTMFENNQSVTDLDIPIEFYQEPTLSLFGSFRESEFNDGSVIGRVTINVLGSTLRDLDPNDYIDTTGLADGLYPVFTKENNSVVMEVEGTTINHGEFDDLNSIRLSFDPLFFENEIASRDVRNIIIDFKDPIDFTIKGSFVESELNNGSISTKLTIQAENTRVTNNIQPRLASLIDIENLPLGLTPSYRVLNSQDIEVTLDGEAYLHDPLLPVNVHFNLDKDIYESGIQPEQIQDIPITYKGAPTLETTGSFEEHSSDDGTIIGELTIELKDDTFLNLSDYSSYVVLHNLPAGLEPKYRREDDNHLVLSLDGTALNANNSNDVTNFSIQFSNTLFAKGVSPSNEIQNLTIDFKDSPKIYLSSHFKESSDNDGTIANEVDLDLFGDRFTSVNPNDYIEVLNVPVGLEPLFTKVSNSKLRLKFLGAALDGSSNNDVANVTLKYAPELFENKVPALETDNVFIDFKDRPELLQNNTLIENSFNDGTFTDALTIQILGDTVEDVSIDEMNRLIRLENLPTGLTPTFKRLNDVEIELKLLGQAVEHDNTLIRPTLIADKSLFHNETPPLPFVLTNINFLTSPHITLSESFVESVENNGSIENAISIVIDGGEFSNADLNSNIITSNLPVGLTPLFLKRNPTLVEMQLLGRAQRHTNDFDTKQVKLDFTDKVFKSGIIVAPVEDLAINFRQKPDISTKSFVESDLNDGSIKTEVTLEITEDIDAFSNVDLNGLIDIQNLPIGLTPRFERLDDKHVKMTIEGKALKHNDEDDVADISLTFKDGVFESGLKANPIINMVVDFRDPIAPIFEANKTVFEERKENDGQTETTIDLTLIGDDVLDPSITDANVGSFITVDARSLPSGLRPSFQVISDKVIQMTLSGSARSHFDKDDTSLNLKFDENLFLRKKAGKDLNDLSVNFDDPLISFDGEFVESKRDDGSIETVVTINILGDSFRNIPYEDHIVVEKLPLGLTPKYKSLNNSQIEMSLEGRAIDHLNEFDVSDLQIKVQPAAVRNGIVAHEDDKVPVDFTDPPPAIQVAGGPGLHGGYLTFISENARELIVSAGTNTADFGLANDYKTTVSLQDILLTKFDAKQLYATGIEKNPDVLIDQKTSIFGLSNKHSSLVILDAVDSASKYLRELRGKVASMQTRLQETSGRLLVQKTNIQSAESSIREIDFAEETAQFQKRSILAQAGNYMLSQANTSQKMVLDLLKF